MDGASIVVTCVVCVVSLVSRLNVVDCRGGSTVDGASLDGTVIATEVVASAVTDFVVNGTSLVIFVVCPVVIWLRGVEAVVVWNFVDNAGPDVRLCIDTKGVVLSGVAVFATNGEVVS